MRNNNTENKPVETITITRDTKITITAGLLISIIGGIIWLTNIDSTARANSRKLSTLTSEVSKTQSDIVDVQVLLGRQDERWQSLQNQIKRIEELLKEKQ